MSEVEKLLDIADECAGMLELEGDEKIASFVNRLVAMIKRHRELPSIMEYVNRTRGYPTAKEWGELLIIARQVTDDCEAIAKWETKRGEG